MTQPAFGRDNEAAIYLAAAISGAVLWLLTSLLAGQREAWDSSLYWSLTYPLCIFASGLLGYLAPRRAWRWGLTIMVVQAVVMVLLPGGSFSLLPLGFVLFGILALPCIAAALLMARLRLRVEQR